MNIPVRRNWRACTLLLVSTMVLQACAGSGALMVARDHFKNGSTQVALQTLEEAEVSQRDQLLLYLDKGLVSQAAERYQDSIVAFESALKLIDDLDYFSARDQTTALVTSDWAIRYRGESSERLWIHTFQMINYLMIDQPQGAAVEARRAVTLFEEHGDVLDQDLFTRYLMALSFETAGQRDSAMVEYRKLNDDYQISLPDPLNNNEYEMVFLVASGFIEPKLPGDLFIDIDARIAFPYYPVSMDTLPVIDVTGNSRQLDFKRVDTTLLPVARSALEQRGKSIAARQALRLAAKYNLADNIGDKDRLAGDIVKLLLLAVERPDTRSWETLPAYLSLIRVAIPKDETSIAITVDPVGPYASAIHRTVIPVNAEAKQRNFRVIRVGIDSL